MLAARTSADKGTQRIGLAAALILHAVALAVLLSYAPVRRALAEAAPIMVSLITPPPVEKPIEPPRPLPVRPVAKRTMQPPVELAPLITLAPTAPAVLETPTREVLAPLPFIQEAAATNPEVVPPATTPPSYHAAYLDNPPPIYPALSKRAGEQGKVMLRALVNAGGAAEVVEIGTSSGSQRLDNAALETVKRWRFVPARQGDQAVAAWVFVPITFKLEG